MRKRVGVVVNPIAGMGGRVGLKGTDGREVLATALRRGASPRSAIRARHALERLRRVAGDVEVLTAPGVMGQEVAASSGLDATVVGGERAVRPTWTTAADTRWWASELLAADLRLLLFVGGDGTARDVAETVGESVTVLGVPAGVKIHSAAFATSPRAAGEVAVRYLTDEGMGERLAEVMDVDEEALRQGSVSARLHGYLRVPADDRGLQHAKARSTGEASAAAAAAGAVAAGMAHGVTYVLGPGTTTAAVMTALGLEGSLVGVDVVRDRQLVAKDASERDLLPLVERGPAQIVVTPIGGQGYLFGRGNQQISPAVIERVGPSNVTVVATPGKLASLQGRPMLVDTDDDAIDDRLRGFARVVVGPGEEAMYPVALGNQ